MLPKGWKRHLLSAIADFDQRSLHSDTHESFRFRYISLSDVSAGKISQDLKTYSFKEAPSRARRMVKTGDILFSTVRPHLLGHAQISESHAECVASTGFSVITVKPAADSTYLYQYLYSHDMRRQIDALVAGSSFPALGSSEVSGLQINLPNIVVQARIGKILLAWDKAIATTENLLSNSRTQLRALMSKLLRLPVPRTDIEQEMESTFPRSVQAGVPKLPPTPPGWRRINLHAHLKEVRRPIALKPDKTYTLVKVKRSRGGVEIRERLKGIDIKTPSQFSVTSGDFLISKRQIVHGACGIVSPELEGAIVSNEYAVLNSDGEIDLQFLRYLSESTYFQQTCFHSSIGVHVEKMIFRTERWLSWPFNIPAQEEQRRIVEVLDTAVQEIACIERQLKALASEKAALMSQILTGKRRLQLPKAKIETAV